MDLLTAFGALAVTAMMVFYAFERRTPTFVLAFAGACLAASAYGFLQGAWPFGVVELVWAVVAAHRWWQRRGPSEMVEESTLPGDRAAGQPQPAVGRGGGPDA